MRRDDHGEATNPLSDVLDRVQGITPAKVQYYVQSRFVEPTKRRQGQVEHNWLTDWQIDFIGLIWRYEKDADLTPRKAYNRARHDVEQGGER